LYFDEVKDGVAVKGKPWQEVLKCVKFH